MGSKAGAAKTNAKRKKIGRPKGVANKFTNLKESFIQSFEEMGGTPELTDWAKNNKRDFYRMVATMLPKNVEMKSESELIIIIKSAIPEPDPPRPGE
jgi:hypothetical protein